MAISCRASRSTAHWLGTSLLRKWILSHQLPFCSRTCLVGPTFMVIITIWRLKETYKERIFTEPIIRITASSEQAPSWLPNSSQFNSSKFHLVLTSASTTTSGPAMAPFKMAAVNTQITETVQAMKSFVKGRSGTRSKGQSCLCSKKTTANSKSKTTKSSIAKRTRPTTRARTTFSNSVQIRVARRTPTRPRVSSDSRSIRGRMIDRIANLSKRRRTKTISKKVKKSNSSTNTKRKRTT